MGTNGRNKTAVRTAAQLDRLKAQIVQLKLENKMIHKSTYCMWRLMDKLSGQATENDVSQKDMSMFIAGLLQELTNIKKQNPRAYKEYDPKNVWR